MDKPGYMVIKPVELPPMQPLSTAALSQQFGSNADDVASRPITNAELSYLDHVWRQDRELTPQQQDVDDMINGTSRDQLLPVEASVIVETLLGVKSQEERLVLGKQRTPAEAIEEFSFEEAGFAMATLALVKERLDHASKNMNGTDASPYRQETIKIGTIQQAVIDQYEKQLHNELAGITSQKQLNKFKNRL